MLQSFTAGYVVHLKKGTKFTSLNILNYKTNFIDISSVAEIALLFDERRVASVIASEISDIFCLTRDDFNSVLSDYPKMRKNMERVARERLAEISKSSHAVKGGSTM